LQLGDTGGTIGTNRDSPNSITYLLKRAPGFFDEVCYTGNGVTSRAINHNLGVAPELMIVKRRNGPGDWYVYINGYNNFGGVLLLNTTGTFPGVSQGDVFGYSGTTATTFNSFVSGYINEGNNPYVAYLFASAAGVSKVGLYSGTGATQTISCGFTGGARFVLIRRTSGGDWYIWDTARGMVSGTDPSLLLNSAAAEVNANSVFTATGGFQIVSTATGINASGSTYMFLAIA
jgi:hypothetical protein